MTEFEGVYSCPYLLSCFFTVSVGKQATFHSWLAQHLASSYVYAIDIKLYHLELRVETDGC